MKRKSISIILAFTLLGYRCNQDKPFYEAKTANPEFRPNTVFISFEDLSSPKFKALKEKYQLDTAFYNEKDEFRRVLLLRNWIRGKIHISDFKETYPGGDSAEGILDAALKGQGFHCGHYMIVQNAVANAYGYVTRCLGAGPGVKNGPSYHHGINEIWSDKYQKWFLSDAKYNHHFEKNGIPLSALEIRDEYLKNRAADMVMVKGPDRTPVEYEMVVNAKDETVKKTKEAFAQVYTWISWEKVNNRFSGWPANSDQLDTLNMYADDYFKNNTWLWEGKPHWAYGTEFMRQVTDRKAIEWTPNTISSKVIIEGNKARIELSSDTPNLKTYQMKVLPGGDWRAISNTVSLKLKNNRNEFVFRTVNLADVAGPEHRVVIAR